MNTTSELADILRCYMREKGWGLGRLAQSSGVSKKTLHNWLKPAGVRKPQTWQPLVKVAATIGLTTYEANTLLKAAGHPSIDQLLAQAKGNPDLALLEPWVVAAPHNLPSQVTSFVGRAAELATLLDLFRHARLVVLTGPGGSGKTRLAIEAAGALRESFADGVCFVDLTALAEPGLVIPTISDTLNLPEAADIPPMAMLRNYLRQRHMILVLDNFEQVVAAAPQVAELLAAASGLRILVTSRVVLRLSGEHEFSLTPLELPDPGQLPPPEALSHYPSIALFIQRARSVRPGFLLGPDNAAAVAAICARLDGLPLAIELAAAWLKLLPPEALLARLTAAPGALGLLKSGPLDLPPRHQGLAAAIDWSYHLLTPAEQRLFRRLAVFNGGCTLEMAEKICNYAGDLGPAILDSMASLIDKSLATTVQDGAATLRITMLATLREYAWEQLSQAGELAVTRDYHASAYIALAEEAFPHLSGRDQRPWFQRLKQEHDNLRAAMAWLIDSGDQERALRMGAAIWLFWVIHGHLSEGRRWLAQLLAGDCRPYPALWAKTLLGAGVLAHTQGDHAHAYDFLSRSVAIQRTLGSGQDLSAALNHLGQLVRDQGDYAAAHSLHHEGLALAQQHGDREGVAAALMSLTQLALYQGATDQAEVLLNQHIAATAGPPDDLSLAIRLSIQAMIAIAQGRYQQAHTLLVETLALREQIGDQRGIVQSLINLGTVALQQNHLAEAQQYFQRSLELATTLLDRRCMRESLLGLGATLGRRGFPALAARCGGAEAALAEPPGGAATLRRRAFEAVLDSGRQRLGPEGWAASWMQGRTLGVDILLAEVAALESRA